MTERNAQRQAATTHTRSAIQCFPEVPVRLAVKRIHQTLHDLETEASASHLSLSRLSEPSVMSVCLCVCERARTIF